MTSGPRKFVLGITGASGAPYSLRLLHLLLAGGHELHLVVTDYGRRLLHDETGIRNLAFAELAPDLARDCADAERRLIIHSNKDVGAVIASGSFLHDGMVILPCTSASMGAITSGAGDNLLCRAAAVCLKERRPLIVCHREMPLSLIDIRNMETLTLAGATICSPNPGFYLHPQRVQDLVDFVVGKVLDHLHVSHDLQTRWQGAANPPPFQEGRGRGKGDE